MSSGEVPPETIREKVEREEAAEREAQAARRAVAEAFANGALVESHHTLPTGGL
jgi:hypothetical protein